MCRMIGYLGGIVLFIVLGVEKLKGYELFFATAIINLVCIALVILFRILAKRLNGFWRVWGKRLQKQVCAALACLSTYTEMPEYEITTTTIDGYGNKTVSTSTTNNTLLWGCVECAVCAILTVLSPIILAFILFCYIEAIVFECRWRDEQKVKEGLKEEEIARQSARMTLTAPLKTGSSEANPLGPVVNYVPTYPMQGAYVSQPYVMKTIPKGVLKFQDDPQPVAPPPQDINNQTQPYVRMEVQTQGESSYMRYEKTEPSEGGGVQYVNIQHYNIRNDGL